MNSTAKQILEIARDLGIGFKLPPKVPRSFFKITKRFSDIDKWKAKILASNAAYGDKKKGEWDDVFYVMISIVDNTIIPIARSDEHHIGYDVLYDVYQDYGVNPDNYVSIASNGNNYISDESQKGISRFIEASKRFLSYGGRDLPVAPLSGRARPTMLVSDFVEHGGFLEIKKGSLSPIGDKIYTQFEELSEAIQQFYKKRSNIFEREIYDLTKELNYILKEYVISTFSFDVLDSNVLKEWWNNAERAIDDENTNEVIDLIFGFGGIKNLIHNNLRAKKTGDSEQIFGDVDLAIELLGNI